MSTDQHTTTPPRRSVLDREVAMRLAAREYELVAEQLERLSPDQWQARTDCPGWDVRAMAGHMLGMAQMAASVPEMMRQQVLASRRHKRDGGLPIDALTAVQVEKNAALSTAALVEAMRETGPKAARGRRRTPSLIRSRSMGEQEGPTGDKEVWTFGYLTDTVLTRDPFMHRIDIARATGVQLEPTPDHEGRIVADVVQEWAGRHGRPFGLELTGPAGGHWDHGDGERISMDAFEFCRVLSGRASGSGLLAVAVPF
jgi:uncharacterized protein (TIGR03083 family)